MTRVTACQREDCDQDEIVILGESADEVMVECPRHGIYTFAK